ncbi:MAG: tetratricopeptide repeat protein [Pseudomonadota bacterium]
MTCAAMGLAPVAKARDIADAMAALNAGQHDTAKAMALPLAEKGNPDAHFILGHLAANGLAGPTDMPLAVNHYSEAALAGQPHAQFALGELAYQGEGAVQDLARAAGWYNLAAAQGHNLAKVRLGYMYAEGQSVPKDPSRAALLFEEAAKAGEPIAQYHLGLLYLDGEGRRRDYAKAAKWFRAAAEQGDADSMYNLALILETGRGGETDLPGTVRGMEAAAREGVLPAKVSMGLLYYNGRGVEASPKLASDWFKDAAEGGSAEGMFLYAVAISEGLTGKRDLVTALKWAEKSVALSTDAPIEMRQERTALRDQLRKVIAQRSQPDRAPRVQPKEPAPVPAPPAVPPQQVADIEEEERESPIVAPIEEMADSSTPKNLRRKLR